MFITDLIWNSVEDVLPEKNGMYLVIYRWNAVDPAKVTVRIAHYFCNRDTESGWYVDADTESLDDYWPLLGEVLWWAEIATPYGYMTWNLNAI